MHKLALAALMTCFAAGAAHADCARPMWLGTPSHTSIPLHGSLYLDDASADLATTPLAVTFSDPFATYRVVRVTDEVARIDYLSLTAGTVDISLGDITHATYVLTDAPPPPPPRVLEFWHDQYAWSCSSTDAVVVQLDQPTAAVLARWTFDGVTDEWLVPPRTYDDVPGLGVVIVGKRNCARANVMPAELAAGGHLELTAIGFDGTRTPIHGLPDRLAFSDMPTTADSIGQSLKMDPDTLEQIARSPVDAPAPLVPMPASWNPMRGLDDAMYAALAIGALAALAIIALLRARPALRDPNG